MSTRAPNRRSRYDDPYTFDDPYLHSPDAHKEPSYEYVGSDEDPGQFPDPPRQTFSPDYDRRESRRATSSPRQSRRADAYPPPDEEVTRRRSNTKGKERNSHHRFHDLAERPAVKRGKSLGRHGLHFLGEAAAVYAAQQAGEAHPGQPAVRANPYGRPYYPEPEPSPEPEPRRSRHRRRYTPSPSPSPSPSPVRSRRSTDYGGRRPKRDRPSLGGRVKSYSTSPPATRSRGGGSRYEPDRGRSSHGRSRRRNYSPTPSPSPSPSPPPRRRGRSSGGGKSSGGGRSSKGGRPRAQSSASFGTSFMEHYTNKPKDADAHRWQMAARAALEAGGLTAFRLRKEPGGWGGEKGAKVATAALGAAAIDAFIDHDPRRAQSTGRGIKGKAENVLSSVLASQLMGFKGSSTRDGKYRYG
ncbi:hypothetical protein GGR56DRAFT_654423 [Xylariaceae sp. FL0804]|nr:hypothetical protein GGR56DRAFT_654423 [Xylariaceae sp. FL0804]